MPNVMAALPNISAGCPKLPNRSQPLVGRSSPYSEDMWGRHCCLKSFSRLLICVIVAKI